MKDEPGWNSVSWIAEFELKSGDQWQDITIPFENFEAQWRGQKVTKNKDGSAFRPMNLEEIHQVGVTLSKFKYISREGVTLNPKFKEGVFMMEFKDISTYV